MRPIHKGNWPLTPIRQKKQVFTDWEKAIPILKERTGWYCHLCEMRVTNALAIEHIKPQKHFPRLVSHWGNFLLICNSCNSAKSETIPFAPYRKRYFWPHKNNTLLVFEYGTSLPLLQPASHLNRHQIARAEALIDLYKLNKQVKTNGESDTRWIERCTALKKAIDRLIEYKQAQATVQSILQMAESTGFFSIWFMIFQDEPVVREALIRCDSFKLAYTNCFDANQQLQHRTQTDL